MYDSHFSIDNIPYGIGTKTPNEAPCVVTRLFDKVIFLDEVAKAGLLSDLPSEIVATFNEVKTSPRFPCKNTATQQHTLTYHRPAHAQRPCFSRPPSAYYAPKKAASPACRHLQPPPILHCSRCNHNAASASLHAQLHRLPM